MSLNERQDLFVTHYLNNGMNATQAYRDAYNAHDRPDSSVNPSASRLLRHPRVRQAIIKKKQGAISKIDQEALVSKSFLIENYIDLLERAKSANQISAGRQCLDSLASLCGFADKQVQVTGSVDHNLLELPTSELLQALEFARHRGANDSANDSASDSDAGTIDGTPIDGNFREISNSE